MSSCCPWALLMALPQFELTVHISLCSSMARMIKCQQKTSASHRHTGVTQKFCMHNSTSDRIEKYLILSALLKM
jgi:hypothetical protein